MDGENRFGKHSFGGADNRLEHAFVGILSRAFGELDNEWRFALHIAAEQAEALFHVVNVVGADGEFAVGDFVELSGGDDHRLKMSILRARRGYAANLKSEIANRKSEIISFRLGWRATSRSPVCRAMSNRCRRGRCDQR